MRFIILFKANSVTKPGERDKTCQGGVVGAALAKATFIIHLHNNALGW